MIEDEMLNRFVRVLNVLVEYLKMLEEDVFFVVFENIINNVYDNKDSLMGFIGYNNDSIINIFNLIDKIIEFYECFFKEKDEKYVVFEKWI